MAVRVAAAAGMTCWGEGDSGELGTGTAPAIGGPVAIPGAGTGTGQWSPSRIAAGGAHSCALDTTGQLRCWGDNSTGAIGDTTTADRMTPTPVMLMGASDVAAGDSATCAQTTAGASCWGSNFFGQLGDGTTTTRRAPVAVKSLAAKADPVVGQQHACALVNGEVDCWGDNALGQLGNGSFSIAPTPVEVAFP